MRRRLPPLNQLRAFEAAARHLSFKDAAAELNVTHSAVSQQIRALEDLLGSQLFQRAPRGVQLTNAARALSSDLTAALDRMDHAVNRFRASDMRGTLRISVVPWYGNRFLVPRLAEFHAMHPGLEIKLHFSYELVDFESGDFHAALRHGYGGWEKVTSCRVHYDHVAPLCAPELVAGQALPLSPEQIAGLDLAVATGQERNWFEWFAATGLDGHEELPFVYFENRALGTEFALNGHGVTLSDVPALRKELDAGHLVRLHPLTVRMDSGMHLVCPESPYADPRLLVVADWLRAVLPSGDEPAPGESGRG